MCVTPPSCGVSDPQCAGVTCCTASVVDAGAFDLRYHYGDDLEESVPRRVRTFVLDRFEVTWGRFATFVFDYDVPGQRPKAGAGAHPAFPDSGWDAAWSESLAWVPDSRRGLEKMLASAGQPVTSQTQNVDLPVRGLNWYMAYAFCIWDGGRLPTEAEWTYAAVGGAQGNRSYPWVPRDLDAPIVHADAVFSDAEQTQDGPAAVGTHSSGQGSFGQDDLAGNLAEWMLDNYQQRLEPACPFSGTTQVDAHECLKHDSGELRVQRGGSFRDGPGALRNTQRSYGVPDRYDQPIGFRCAREMPPATVAVAPD